MDAVDPKRNGGMADDMDTSETLSEKRSRAKADAVETSGDLPMTQEQCCRVSDLHLAFVADKEIVKGRAQWWNPDAKAR